MALLSEELKALKENILKGNKTDTPPEIELPEEKESVLITYSLPGRSRSKKMLLNYELVGRNGKSGLLQALNGRKITSGCLIIPSEKEKEMCEFFKKNEVEFSMQKITLHSAEEKV